MRSGKLTSKARTSAAKGTATWVHFRRRLWSEKREERDRQKETESQRERERDRVQCHSNDMRPHACARVVRVRCSLAAWKKKRVRVEPSPETSSKKLFEDPKPASACSRRVGPEI